MSNKSHIQFGDTTITYEIHRSQRRKKKVQITVSSSGVQLLAPAATPDHELADIVRKRAPWILSHSTETMWEATQKQFTSGETLPYLGRNVRLIVSNAEAPSPQVRFDYWSFRVDTPPELTGEERTEQIRRAFVEWYHARAAEHLPQRIEHWWPKVGGNVKPRVLIRDQRSRWASCAWDGTLRFNWRVMMLQPDLIDYLVVHELTHLIVMNHSSVFWELVSYVIPDAKARRQRLRKVECLLPLQPI